MADVDRLKTALADRYRIEREIGAGGMAVVYVAEDLKHKRKVALKVLRAELAAAIGSERFVREIEIAAKLSHPHILPLYDSGDADGALYYVMPYVDGESLRERLDRDGKIPIPEMVRLTDEIASALSYAHEQGIVHRDVKPENVMLSGGRAVVADFGIARAVTVAGGERLTGTGFAVGTPAYMSPEQAFGDSNVDGRSDVYALGCVAYEMVSGRAPFVAETPQALLAKHAADTVPSMRASDASIPLFVERAVERSLAKDPKDRFQSAKEFAEALTSEMVVARVGRGRWTRLALAVPVTVVVLAAAVWGYLSFQASPAYERLAVLPPTNRMNDPDQEYFVQGMHEALINELQRAGVPVIARTSVLQYQSTQKPIREIATELRVDALIESSVFRSADSVELEVRLVDGSTEEYLADPIARSGEFRNVVALYRELTGAIAAEIQAALTPQAEARLASARPVDPEAYEAYLRGQFHFTRLTPVDIEQARQYFERALEIDPDYALAHAGIALIWVALNQTGLVPPREAGPRARAAVLRALELDSTLVDVQYASALVKTWTDWDWAGGEAAFLRAIDLNPNFPDARALYSHLLLSLKRPEEAMEQMELAVQLDPFNFLVQGLHGMALFVDRRLDEALAQFQLQLRTVPNHPMGLSGIRDVYDAKGMYEESLAPATELYAALGLSEVVETLTSGHAEGGYSAAMREAADFWAGLSSQRYVAPLEVANLYAMAGEDSLALDWLERGFEERDPNLPYLNVWPQYDAFREHMRFVDLVRRMNLPL